MIRFLIAEDEPLELLALEGGIRRLYGEEAEILCSEDGAEALCLCLSRHPDILITDISLPEMTGIECIRALRKNGFRGKILIITAYDTSDYIRQALSLGVTDYLLKPVRRQALRDAVDKCLSLIGEEQARLQKETQNRQIASYAKHHLASDLLSGTCTGEALESICGWQSQGGLQAAAAVIDGKGPFPRLPDSYFSILRTKTEGLTVLFLKIREGSCQEERLLILQCCMREFWKNSPDSRIAVGALQDNCQSLGASARELVQKLCRPDASGGNASEKGRLFLPGSGEKEAKLRRRWEQRLREGDAVSFVRMFRRRAADKSFWACASLLCEVLFLYDPALSQEELLCLLRQDRVYASLESYLSAYFQRREGQTEISFLLSWMRQHCSEEITREQAAEILGLSETYFSHLFRSRTGKSFIQMLNEIRISKARHMLEGGERDYEKIAQACGYTSKKYFFGVFRRLTGCAVTDYNGEEKT